MLIRFSLTVAAVTRVCRRLFLGWATPYLMGLTRCQYLFGTNLAYFPEIGPDCPFSFTILKKQARLSLGNAPDFLAEMRQHRGYDLGL